MKENIQEQSLTPQIQLTHLVTLNFEIQQIRVQNQFLIKERNIEHTDFQNLFSEVICDFSYVILEARQPSYRQKELFEKDFFSLIPLGNQFSQQVMRHFNDENSENTELQISHFLEKKEKILIHEGYDHGSYTIILDNYNKPVFKYGGLYFLQNAVYLRDNILVDKCNIQHQSPVTVFNQRLRKILASKTAEDTPNQIRKENMTQKCLIKSGRNQLFFTFFQQNLCDQEVENYIHKVGTQIKENDIVMSLKKILLVVTDILGYEQEEHFQIFSDFFTQNEISWIAKKLDQILNPKINFQDIIKKDNSQDEIWQEISEESDNYSNELTLENSFDFCHNFLDSFYTQNSVMQKNRYAISHTQLDSDEEVDFIFLIFDLYHQQGSMMKPKLIKKIFTRTNELLKEFLMAQQIYQNESANAYVQFKGYELVFNDFVCFQLSLNAQKNYLVVVDLLSESEQNQDIRVFNFVPKTNQVDGGYFDVKNDEDWWLSDFKLGIHDQRCLLTCISQPEMKQVYSEDITHYFFRKEI